MIESLLTLDGVISLVTLVLLEIVLGIDNIIFIAILCSYLPKSEQQRARVLGLSMALVMRVLLLMGISWLAHLTEPLFSISGFGASGRDLILFAGGLFLIYKTVSEIYHKLKGHAEGVVPAEKKLTVSQAILQIMVIDVVFSFDSILTAVGLSNNLLIMIVAVVVAMIVMIFFARYVSDFINKYPTIKMLALAFLVCIGVLLLFESLHIHVAKSYIYFAMVFSLLVELLNIRFRKVKSRESNDIQH
jgi:predicted tellurium resistance membrane protein TerC